MFKKTLFHKPEIKTVASAYVNVRADCESVKKTINAYEFLLCIFSHNKVIMSAGGSYK